MTEKKPYIIKREEGNIHVAYRNESYWKDIDQQRYELLLKKTSIPPFYWKINWKDYKGELSKDNVDKCKKYAENCFTNPKFDYANLYLWSDLNSSQKTALMANIGKEAIRQNKTVNFVLFGKLVHDLMKVSGYSVNEDIESYLKKLKESDMLLIDDVFDSKKSIYWKNNDLIISEIDLFFRDLLSSNKKIVLTSNVSPNNIGKLFGVSLQELISRNFIDLEFKDSVKYHRKKMFDKIFED